MKKISLEIPRTGEFAIGEESGMAGYAKNGCSVLRRLGTEIEARLESNSDMVALLNNTDSAMIRSQGDGGF